MLKLIRHAVLALALVCGAAASGNAQEEWQPYNFERTRYVELDFALTEDAEKTSGNAIMEFEEAGAGQLKMLFKGSYGAMTSEFATTGPADQLYQQALPQIMMSPAGAPMMATLFAPYWGMFFAGRQVTIGSGWSYSDGNSSMSFRVEEECSGAGVQGVRVVWRQDDRVRADACISPDVPLPLSLDMQGETGQVYEVRMRRYERRQ